jgi:hypothetical protein
MRLKFLCAALCGEVELSEMKQAVAEDDHTLVCPRCGGCMFYLELWDGGERITDISEIPLKDLEIILKQEKDDPRTLEKFEEWLGDTLDITEESFKDCEKQDREYFQGRYDGLKSALNQLHIFRGGEDE